MIRRDRALRDIVGDRRQIAHNALARFRSRIRHDAEIDQIAVLQTSAAQVALIDEHDITTPGDPHDNDRSCRRSSCCIDHDF